LKLKFKNYLPHPGQQAFHYALNNIWRFVAMIAGIRGGKTVAGAHESGKQAWEARGKGVYLIIAPTYNMLDRTTWVEFREANRALIESENETKKIITLKNGRQVHGHSAENPDRIRNETAVGFWGDEMREAKNFKGLWDILLGRVLSTEGRGFITTSPNSYDDIHDIFIANKKPEYGTVRFSTYENTYLNKERIDELASNYDQKFMQQELLGEFVIFEGAVYYTFNRQRNAGDLAFEVAKYNPILPLRLCCDFNVDPMAWPVAQIKENDNGLAQIYVIDEIYLKNSNTHEACQEFKNRYPNHRSGLYLYGDATGQARHTSSHVTDWKIIEDELNAYGITKRVPTTNPAERDRVNAVNSILCNSKGESKVLINPQNCKHLIRDFEQVSFKEGSTQIDKGKDLSLTHSSDAFGYMAEKEFSLAKGRFTSLKI
jgi:hypothetical protein